MRPNVVVHVFRIITALQFRLGKSESSSVFDGRAVCIRVCLVFLSMPLVGCDL